MSDEPSTPPIPGSMRPWACHDGHIFSVRDGEHIGNVEGYFDAQLIVTAVNQHDALLARILCLESDLALERGRVEGLTEGVERLKAERCKACTIEREHYEAAEIEHETQVASLKVALSDAIDLGQTAAACTSERGRTTADGASRALEALRTVHLSPPASAQGEEDR